jgi:hypothetical protein
MDEYFNARWGDRGAIKVIPAVELLPRGQFWIDAGAAKEIESNFRLWDGFIPQRHGELGVE